MPPIVNVAHHNAHAAMFFVSPFEEALVLVMDGYGDDCSSSAYVGRGNRLERLWSTGIMNSVGLVYTFVTEYLGFCRLRRRGQGDGARRLRRGHLRRALPRRDRGRRRTAATPSTWPTSATTCSASCAPSSASSSTPSGRRASRGEPLTDRHRDVAFALQAVTEEIVLHLVRTLLKQHPGSAICA